MNVLILTPERVGGNLLQSALTIYMTARDFGKPVVATHDICQGLVAIYNDRLQQRVIKRGSAEHQSLQQIVDLLSSADHYMVSALGYRPFSKRKDDLASQLDFYQYLNENFFIICAERSNVLENALSWCIQSHSKIFNIWFPGAKVDLDQSLENYQITVDMPTLYQYLDRYSRYRNWAHNYFDIQSFYNYDDHKNNIEDYILRLPFMYGCPTWQDMFGQSFEQFNTCHRLLSYVVTREHVESNQNLTWNCSRHLIKNDNWNKIKGPDWPSSWVDYDPQHTPAEINHEISGIFNCRDFPVSTDEHDFIQASASSYKLAVSQIQLLQELDIVSDGIPIKLHTLSDKIKIIKNFDQCVDWYNSWCAANNGFSELDKNKLCDLATAEQTRFLNYQKQLS